MGVKPLAVSLGDPAGIGPELLAEAWAQRSAARLSPFFAVGGARLLASAARARGLEFVPLVHERYHLACRKASLDQPATLALRNLLQTPEWLAHMATLPGYSAWHCGEVLAMSTVLPWWQFARKKRASAPRKKP